MSDELVIISKGNYDTLGPCWISREFDGQKRKPEIKCQCGRICNIGLHHVHADGTVTRSFFHSAASSFVENGVTYAHVPGCGWHVWIKLADYFDGDFPPQA